MIDVLFYMVGYNYQTCIAIAFKQTLNLTLPYLWGGQVVTPAQPALRPYHFGPMRNPDVTRRSQLSAAKPKSAVKPKNHQPPGTGDM